MKCDMDDTAAAFLKFTVTGRFSSEEGKEILKRIADGCATQKKSKVLVYVTLDEKVPSTFDRYDLGVFVSNLFLDKIIMAVVVKSAQVSRFSETVAHNRGTRIFITESEGDAVSWLNHHDARR